MGSYKELSSNMLIQSKSVMKNWYRKSTSIENRKNTKYFWFLHKSYLKPTQLWIHGQWWSNFLTHLLQCWQCLILWDLLSSQYAHTKSPLYFSYRSRMFISEGCSKQGSLFEAIWKARKLTQKTIIDPNVQYLFMSGTTKRNTMKYLSKTRIM